LEHQTNYIIIVKGIPIYETVLSITEGYPAYTYGFVSEGEVSLPKLIQFSPFETEFGVLYNLGFGDYDEESGNIIDLNNSNNSDMYTVFNTVLHSVLDFFNNRPNDKIYVTGSDNEDNEEFVVSCKANCDKGCDATVEKSIEEFRLTVAI